MDRFSSLYVHFPFCESKCHYCDFYSVSPSNGDRQAISRYLAAIEREVKSFLPRVSSKLVSLYQGGGTPSLLSPADFDSTYTALDLSKRLNHQTEWTIEINPSSITGDLMKLYRSAGINRISIGVQSTQDKILAWLGRRHSRHQAIEAINLAFETGFTDVTVDLMCAIPGQTIQDLGASLKELTAFPITHLSCYLLTLHDGHFALDSQPSEQEQLEQYLFVDRFLNDVGFEHYEISNFCRNGHRSTHNLNYWKGGSYLSFGTSAHSFDASAGKRWKNVSSITEYCDRLFSDRSPIEWEETLSAEQKALERWMLGLRLNDGVPTSWFGEGSGLLLLEKLIETGLAETYGTEPPKLRLTPRGFAVCDDLVVEIARKCPSAS